MIMDLKCVERRATYTHMEYMNMNNVFFVEKYLKI